MLAMQPSLDSSSLSRRLCYVTGRLVHCVGGRATSGQRHEPLSAMFDAFAVRCVVHPSAAARGRRIASLAKRRCKGAGHLQVPNAWVELRGFQPGGRRRRMHVRAAAAALCAVGDALQERRLVEGPVSKALEREGAVVGRRADAMERAPARLVPAALGRRRGGATPG